MQFINLLLIADNLDKYEFGTLPGDYLSQVFVRKRVFVYQKTRISCCNCGDIFLR